MNKVILVGRLGQDPRTAYTQAGSAVTNFSLATDESFVDRDGKKVDRTEWHRIVSFGKQAENCGKFLEKGRQVLVEGSLQTRKWQDQQGQDRFTTEIKAQRVQFLGNNRSQGQEGTPQGRTEAAYPSEAQKFDDAPF